MKYMWKILPVFSYFLKSQTLDHVPRSLSLLKVIVFAHLKILPTSSRGKNKGLARLFKEIRVGEEETQFIVSLLFIFYDTFIVLIIINLTQRWLSWNKSGCSHWWEHRAEYLFEVSHFLAHTRQISVLETLPPISSITLNKLYNFICKIRIITVAIKLDNAYKLLFTVPGT